MNQNQMNNGQQPQQGRQFTEVGGADYGTQFTPHATEKNNFYFDPNNPGNILEGYLKSMNDGIPTLYGVMTTWSIQKVNPDGTLGETFSVVSDTFLSDRLNKIPLSSYIRIQYKGKTLKKDIPAGQNWSKTNSFHTWGVMTDPNAIPMNQLTQGYVPTRPAPVAASQPATVSLPSGLQYQQAANTNAYAQPQFQQAPPTPVFNNVPPAPQFVQNPNQQQANQIFQQTPAQQQQFKQQTQQPQTFTPLVNNQQSFVAPAPVQPTFQQQNLPNNTPAFGGQPINGNPFSTDDLPF